MRRYFTDAIPKGKEYDYTAFRQCREYSSAPSCLIVSGTQKQKIILRSRENILLEKEKPIWRDSANWLDQQRPNKGTRLAKAVNYAQNRKDTLMTYLEDGHCSLSNNLSEMQSDHSLLAGKTGCSAPARRGMPPGLSVYTMVEMAKANDLNTYKYLTYLLSQRPDAKMSDENSWTACPMERDCEAELSKLNIEQNACIYHFGASVIHGSVAIFCAYQSNARSIENTAFSTIFTCKVVVFLL